MKSKCYLNLKSEHQIILKPFKLLINMAAADLLILLNGIIKIKREISYELSLDTWMGTSKFPADCFKAGSWNFQPGTSRRNHWPNDHIPA